MLLQMPFLIAVMTWVYLGFPIPSEYWGLFAVFFGLIGPLVVSFMLSAGKIPYHIVDFFRNNSYLLLLCWIIVVLLVSIPQWGLALWNVFMSSGILGWKPCRRFSCLRAINTMITASSSRGPNPKNNIGSRAPGKTRMGDQPTR